ncbi:hypothetical protein SSOG_09087, partial [Streptomyces himastatinicus ATCC 53653]
MGRFKPKAAHGRTRRPQSGVCDTSFVMARAQWLGYTADPRPTGQRVTIGRATEGQLFEDAISEVSALSRHTEQP